MKKKISIINACTDLGVNVNGAALGAQILTKDFNCSNISNIHAESNNNNIANIHTESNNNNIANIHAESSNNIANIYTESNNNIANIYTVMQESIKGTVDFKNFNTNKETLDDFVKEFNNLLLKMHELHFENNMTENEIKLYNQKMQNLVLAVKALDSKCEKRNMDSINKFNEELYKVVSKVLENNEFPLTVGGDHIVAIASSLASIKKHKNLGIIWFDSHGDFNTYSTSVTGNLHGLPLAVATHYEKDILAPFHNGPFYNPKNTVIVGGRDIDPWEWGNIIDAGVTVFSTKDIQNLGAEVVCKKAFEIASCGTNGVHVSFDLDLIDPEVAPGVSVPALNGINLEQTYNLVDEILKYANIIKSADLVEFNPIFDKNHVTENIAKNILCRIRDVS